MSEGSGILVNDRSNDSGVSEGRRSGSIEGKKTGVSLGQTIIDR